MRDLEGTDFLRLNMDIKDKTQDIIKDNIKNNIKDNVKDNFKANIEYNFKQNIFMKKFRDNI